MIGLARCFAAALAVCVGSVGFVVIAQKFGWSQGWFISMGGCAGAVWLGIEALIREMRR